MELQHQSFQRIFRVGSFRTDWFDLLAVSGTLESSPAPQYKNISFLALSHLYGPAHTSIPDYWKNYCFDYMDLCQQSDLSVFNVLSRFVIAFLSRNKCLSLSWRQSMSPVILELKEIKSVTVSTFSPFV